jgi:hypothetical protein
VEALRSHAGHGRRIRRKEVEEKYKRRKRRV